MPIGLFLAFFDTGRLTDTFIDTLRLSPYFPKTWRENAVKSLSFKDRDQWGPDGSLIVEENLLGNENTIVDQPRCPHECCDGSQRGSRYGLDLVKRIRIDDLEVVQTNLRLSFEYI